MEWIYAMLTVVIGLVLRFALPVGVTFLVVLWLRWLDDRWQKEADGLQTPNLVMAAVRCWEVMNCPPEKRATCPAYQNGSHPCWQVLRDKDGLLQQQCLDCKVFREAPVPVPV
jgi:hypothetical protein